MSQVKTKKIFKIAFNTILYLFLALCVFSVILTLLSNKSPDGAAEIFGYQMRIVTSNSMEECEFTDVSQYDIKDIPVRSMVFVDTVPKDQKEAEEWYASLKVGDVLTFRYVYTSQITITHRITSITPKEGGYIIELAGDNRNANASQLYQTIDTSKTNSTNYIIGRVTGTTYILGVIMSLLTTSIGLICSVIIPCFIIILLEISKIFMVLNAEKKERMRKEAANTEKELAELKEKLAELEKNAKTEATAASDATSEAKE